MMMGESENVAKNAVEEQSMSGSLLLSNRNAFLKVPVRFLIFSIAWYKVSKIKQSVCRSGIRPDHGHRSKVPVKKPLISALTTSLSVTSCVMLLKCLIFYLLLES